MLNCLRYQNETTQKKAASRCHKHTSIHWLSYHVEYDDTFISTFVRSFVRSDVDLRLVQSNTIAHMIKHPINSFKVKVKSGHQNAFANLMWHKRIHMYKTFAIHSFKFPSSWALDRCEECKQIDKQTKSRQASASIQPHNQPSNQHTFYVQCSRKKSSIESEISFRFSAFLIHSSLSSLSVYDGCSLLLIHYIGVFA